MSTYTIYMLLCSDGTYYTGITNDLSQRLKQHNGELKGGAKYTTGRRPVVIVYTEKFNSLSEAAKREYALKKLSRKQKQALIKKHTILLTK